MRQTYPNVQAQLASQQAQSQSIGAIQSPAALRTQKRIVLTLVNGAAQDVMIEGDFVYVERCRLYSTVNGIIWGHPAQGSTGFNPTIKPDTAGVALPIFEGNLHKFPEDFTKIQVVAPATGTTSITLWVGFGEFVPPNTRVEPLTFNFFQAATIITAGAYAIGDGVGPGAMLFNLFPDEVTSARIVRARLSKQTVGTANANFRAYLFNGQPNAITQTDHVPFVLTFSMLDYLVGVIEFPQFIAGTGASDMAFCDVAGINLPIYKSPNGTLPTGLFVVLVALAAYVSVNPENYRLDLSAEYN